MDAPRPTADTDERMMRLQLAPKCLASIGWIACVAMWLIAGVTETAGGEGVALSFDRDVRPLLARACFSCHGPDAAQRQTDWRLDSRHDLFDTEVAGGKLVVPGSAETSLLWQRVASKDAELQMPPPDAHQQLSERERSLIRSWIDQGADWDRHWALRPIRRPPVPRVRDADWPRNPIDAFVLARLEAEHLAPSAPPDRATWLRRVTFDLTGLPPTPDEVDAFLADDRPGAVQRVVDRLLASPRYGERFATCWLDSARYADTNGHFMDNGRDMWAWRDWVVKALNDNLPFDQFSIQQLAGDLLPNASRSQIVASGFHRNHGLNFEAGALEEECRIGYVMDRTNTTAAVWLGLTLQCAQCHDHPYDPITQREYYQFLAYFNNIDEDGVAGHWGNAEPLLPLPTEHQERELAALRQEQHRLRQRLDADVDSMADDSDANSVEGLPSMVASLEVSPVVHCSFADAPTYAPYNACGEPISVDGRAHWADGRVGQALVLLGQTTIDCGYALAVTDRDAFSCSGWFLLPEDPAGLLFSQWDSDQQCGWQARFGAGELTVRIADPAGGEIQHRLASPAPGRWIHIAICYDGSGRASGLNVYYDGQRVESHVAADSLQEAFAADEVLRVGGGESEERWVGMIDSLTLFADGLTADQVQLLASTAMWQEDLSAIDDAERAIDVTRWAALVCRSEFASELWDAWSRMELRRQIVENEVGTVMVMRERHDRRPTYVLSRGSYEHPQEEVQPRTPSLLPPLATAPRGDRLELAQWLFQADHPLTARVAANRAWQAFFGEGLVRTPGDFGAQGERPTHPELLDWLAVELIESGWDLKALHRLIVTSATYRQSSGFGQPGRQRDPDLRLLWRMPRRRLEAEMVRDAALAYSGLLCAEIGGQGVYPYQPPGLWKENSFRDTYTAQEYVPSQGPGLYRRSLYTFWKRTCPPPEMMLFDAPSREVCALERCVSRSPLQALVTLNSITHVEAARGLAYRVLRARSQPGQRLDELFRIVLSRSPTPLEIEAVTGLLDRQLQRFRREPRAARKLNRVGQWSVPLQVDAAELAAWSVVAATVMNLDESLTRN
ncbi:MAG: DUF1553 domain-containing protein [Planctomycetota bacterium]|nr:MAG: DUF1553 domain-containing protein [Planctomycetota bacterium]